MDPYFFERANTNYTPTDEEIPRIRSIRNTLQTAVASFDREIALLQERRKNHAQDLERCDRLLAPMKKVPDDVLSSIFLACCGPSDSKPQTMSPDHPAVVASHVCRAWRRLALSTAPLWSKLAIIPPSHPRDSTPYPEHPYTLMEEAKVRWESRMGHLVDMTRIWIYRPRAWPLSTVLRLTMANASATDLAEDLAAPVTPLFTALIDLACSVAFRWERTAIDIVAERNTDIDTILTLKAEDVPLLHTVRPPPDVCANRHCGHLL
ncbi:hypothetical protein FA13DRAFT_913500 [Coprinellus micaceus]|jgi:hypothetical protein|uniref:Uncharacterized protein n=1 Tax=Coprinellus micaceus TaxID=71717 RepID=A0A4Y7TTK6_COPMI|nr:hypothetical protein FA13DRAFT_913500 [Coprinellus micaceus]